MNNSSDQFVSNFNSQIMNLYELHFYLADTFAYDQESAGIIALSLGLSQLFRASKLYLATCGWQHKLG